MRSCIKVGRSSSWPPSADVKGPGDLTFMDTNFAVSSFAPRAWGCPYVQPEGLVWKPPLLGEASDFFFSLTRGKGRGSVWVEPQPLVWERLRDALSPPLRAGWQSSRGLREATGWTVTCGDAGIPGCSKLGVACQAFSKPGFYLPQQHGP